MPRSEKHFSSPARKGEVADGLSGAAERNGGTVSLLAMSKVQRAFLRVLLVVVVGGVLLAPAQAQFGPLGSKVADETLLWPQQGSSVSISRDGLKMVVGAPQAALGVGEAAIYTRSAGGTIWSGPIRLTGASETGVGQFGTSVAISGDGLTAIVGAPQNDSLKGAVWIFFYNAGVWSLQAGPLVGSLATGPAWQGMSVAISEDGNTAVAGGPGDSGGVGAVWVWTRAGASWSEYVGGKLTPSDATANAQFGYSVGLSTDGSRLVVGGPGDHASSGAAWFFNYSGGWSQVGSKQVGSNATGTSAQQGFSVAMSGDGNTAIVGGPGNNSSTTNNVGAVWMFNRTWFGSWSEEAGPATGAAATGGAHQGQSVALSRDGNRAIVGGYSDNANVGAAWVYVQSDGKWGQSGNLLKASDALGPAKQGWAVAMSLDGTMALVGGPGDAVSTGAVWAYVPVPDLTITITDGGGFDRGQNNKTLTIKVKNSGLAATNAAITVTVPLAAASGLTYASYAGTGWTCSEATSSPTVPGNPVPPGYPPPAGVPTVTCTHPGSGGDARDPGASFDDLTLYVNVAIGAPPVLSVSASVSGGGESNTDNDSAADSITLPMVPDLTTNVSHTGSLYVGRTLEYTIRVSNIGNGPTSGTVQVASAVPDGFTVVAVSTMGTSWICDVGTLVCTLSDVLQPSTSYSGAIKVTGYITRLPVGTHCPGSLTQICANYTATVSLGGEVNTTNDSATDAAHVSAATSAPGLSVSLSHVGTFTRGGTGTYEMVVSNTGAGPTSGTVTVTDTLPASGVLTYATVDGGRAWSCGVAGLATCTRKDALPPGTSYHFITVTVNVSGTVSVPSTATSTATVSGGSVGVGSPASDTVTIAQ